MSENTVTQPTIFVTIGTDHHKFTRIIDWIDEWLEAHPEFAERTLVQHGQSRPSTHAHNTSFIEYDDLMATMRGADAVVVHGGPASIFESRAQGRMPLCIPRDPELDEIIDEHQQRFARNMAERGMVILCEEKDTFFAALDTMLADPASGDVELDAARLQPTLDNLEQVVSSLRHQPPVWRRLLAAGHR